MHYDCHGHRLVTMTVKCGFNIFVLVAAHCLKSKMYIDVVLQCEYKKLEDQKFPFLGPKLCNFLPVQSHAVIELTVDKTNNLFNQCDVVYMASDCTAVDWFCTYI